MSAEHVGWAFRQNAGSPTRKLVLVALADLLNKDTLKCCPKIETLMVDCDLGDRAVRQALKDLCDMKLISRVRRRRSDGTLSNYNYVFPQVHVAAPPAAPNAGSPAAPRAGHEPEVDLEPILLAAAPRERPRNEIWDTLTHMFGEPATPSATRARGKVCAELKAARASPDEILQRGRNWPSHFDGATLTEHALVKHWHTLARKPLRRR